MNRVAWLVVDAVMFFSTLADQIALVHLVYEMRKIDPAEMGWTEEQKQRYPDWKQWIEHDHIMTLLEDARESRYAHRLTPIEEDDVPREDTATEYLNINSFFAWWFVQTGNLYDLEYGVLRIKEALETYFNPNIDDNAITRLSIEIPVAAKYLLVTAQELYDRTGTQDAFTLALPLDGTATDLWHGEAGFSRERWEFWKERLLEISIQTR